MHQKNDIPPVRVEASHRKHEKNSDLLLNLRLLFDAFQFLPLLWKESAHKEE